MAMLKISPPWVEHYRKIEAMFRFDPEVRVIYDDEGSNYKVLLYVSDPVKADALEQLLPKEQKFGKITLKIIVVPPNEGPERAVSQGCDMIEDAFKNNPAVNYVRTVMGIGNVPIVYVVCRNYVVQYFNDNLADAHGICSTLFENIARDIFVPMPGVYYCTDIEQSNFVNGPIGMPLGEWP